MEDSPDAVARVEESLVTTPSGHGPRHRRRRAHLGWAQWLLLLVPVVVIIIGGWSHRWASDDSYIDFRVVHNVLAGHGPVFNVGERVEVGKVPQRVVRQDERGEVRDEILEVGRDAGDPVVGEQERSQAREAREAVEGEDAVVGEVDRVELVLFFFFFFFF